MITVSHLSHRFKVHHEQWISALDDISLTFSDGEYAAIIGPNGSGKTTLVQCLNALITPTSGRITVDHFNPSDPKDQWEVRRRLGMVFQNPDNQIISATVEREIAFGLENLGLPTPLIQSRVEETLDRFNLLPYRHSSPHRLSGGEKQRLAVASVMAMEPKYLILDEPTSLLDPQNRRSLLSLLRDIHSEGKTTVLHITQFPEEALQADRLIVLVQGKVMKDGTPQSIFEQPSQLSHWGLEAPLILRLNEAINKAGLCLPDDILSKPDQGYEKRTDLPISCPATSQGYHPLSGVLTTEHLYYVYEAGPRTQTAALKDVCLSIERGECVGLIGPTGSGKTTLAENLTGLLKPYTGRIQCNGVDLWGRNKEVRTVRRKVGLVFQFPELQFFEENVQDEVAFGPRNIGFDETKVEKHVKDALECVGLNVEVFGCRSPLSLSSGEKRLVAIASILSMKPEILVLDEPTAGLDPQGVRRIFHLVHNLHEAGRTIVLISHNIDLVAQVADRIVVLHEGTIVLQGSPQHVFEHHDVLFSMGLDIPETTKILKVLRLKGWDVNPHVFTFQDAIEEIVTHHPPSLTIK